MGRKDGYSPQTLSMPEAGGQFGYFGLLTARHGETTRKPIPPNLRVFVVKILISRLRGFA
jgi:hypothetical protein